MKNDTNGPRKPCGKIQCTVCGDVIESTHRHDFKWCKCGSVFVDGGREYLRAGGSFQNIRHLAGPNIKNSEEKTPLGGAFPWDSQEVRFSLSIVKGQWSGRAPGGTARACPWCKSCPEGEKEHLKECIVLEAMTVLKNHMVHF